MTQTHTHEQTCERAGDLVAYVYGEANDEERGSFTRHLAVCGTCRAEAAAFGIVREDFAVWRTAAPELTSADAARYVAEQVAPTRSELNRVARFIEARHERDSSSPRSLRQTWRALAELLRVTPRWALGASGAAAIIAVCVLAGTSLNDFGARTPTPDALNENANVATMNPHSSAVERIVAPDESEIESRINREVARRLAEREEAEVISDARAITTTASLRNDNTRSRTVPRRTPARPRRSSTKPPAGSFGDEADLPRLSDLLDGAE